MHIIGLNHSVSCIIWFPVQARNVSSDQFSATREQVEHMTRILILLLTVMAALPATAQLYSYRNKAGKLVITDRPIKGDDHTLVDTYIPKDVLEKRKEMEEDEARRVTNNARNSSKYRLSKKQVRGLAVPIAPTFRSAKKKAEH